MWWIEGKTNNHLTRFLPNEITKQYQKTTLPMGIPNITKNNRQKKCIYTLGNGPSYLMGKASSHNRHDEILRHRNFEIEILRCFLGILDSNIFQTLLSINLSSRGSLLEHNDGDNSAFVENIKVGMIDTQTWRATTPADVVGNSTAEARTLGLSNGDMEKPSLWLDAELLELLEPGLPPSRPGEAYAKPRSRKIKKLGNNEPMRTYPPRAEESLRSQERWSRVGYPYFPRMYQVSRMRQSRRLDWKIRWSPRHGDRRKKGLRVDARKIFNILSLKVILGVTQKIGPPQSSDKYIDHPLYFVRIGILYDCARLLAITIATIQTIVNTTEFGERDNIRTFRRICALYLLRLLLFSIIGAYWFMHKLDLRMNNPQREKTRKQRPENPRICTEFSIQHMISMCFKRTLELAKDAKRPRIPQIRVSNTRLAQAASGCAPSVDVLPIFDVKQQSVRNPARMGGPAFLVGLVTTTSVWEGIISLKPESPEYY
ncbi:hypothetical protein WN51_07036 [Melipona quadrifasciata]|uniref:Uncharacterized protein n=1 Tax=Melipona quadrifasciata TaxID=166423 RepID=A0A0M8ZR58_9HYME|nr:hypothetical protein WN51_07036 [Melipona quadrifasciata]